MAMRWRSTAPAAPSGQSPGRLVKALFDDFAAAAPLSKLATTPCLPPPTVVAPLLITFADDTSPNIACSADAKEAALLADAQAIAHARSTSRTTAVVRCRIS